MTLCPYRGANLLKRVEMRSALADFDLMSRRISFGGDLAQALLSAITPLDKISFLTILLILTMKSIFQFAGAATSPRR